MPIFGLCDYDAGTVRSHVFVASSVCVACAFVACTTDPDPPASVPSTPEGTTLVVLPDTQFYACAYGEIFEQQTRWIVSQRESRQIAMVVHTGDIVDADNDAQWRVATDSLRILDGEVPYLITTGNHDLSMNRATLFTKFLGTRGLALIDEASTYEPHRSDNSYAVVKLAGREWLVLGLEFGPRDRVVQWAEEVLDAHADLPAIVFTHAYLYNDGLRYDRNHDPRQPYHPDDYVQTVEQGVNDGEDLWAKLVAPRDNVRLVLSGHVIPDGTARTSERRAGGAVVHQVLANYQWCGTCPCAEREGGGGYLRILEFSASDIAVSTYSPHYDDWLRDDENQFRLELD